MGFAVGAAGMGVGKMSTGRVLASERVALMVRSMRWARRASRSSWADW
ncbi:MAG: hypothetical protein R3B70_17200 [Polyangiaceae bacterium]